MNCIDKLSAYWEKLVLLNDRYSKSGKSVLFKFDIGEDKWASTATSLTKWRWTLGCTTLFVSVIIYSLSLSLFLFYSQHVSISLYITSFRL